MRCPKGLRAMGSNDNPSSFVAVAEIYVNERGLEPTKTEVNVFGRKNWDLVYQTLSANHSGTKFDVCERLVQVLRCCRSSTG